MPGVQGLGLTVAPIVGVVRMRLLLSWGILRNDPLLGDAHVLNPKP